MKKIKSIMLKHNWRENNSVRVFSNGSQSDRELILYALKLITTREQHKEYDQLPDAELYAVNCAEINDWTVTFNQ